MRISNLHIHHNCGPHFRFCLESGSCDHLFVLFQSPCIVYTATGYRQAAPGHFMLYHKSAKQEYYGTEGDFIHDYVRFNGDETWIEMLAQRIGWNLLHTAVPDNTLETLFQLAATEYHSLYEQRNETLTLLTRLLLTKAAEYVDHSATGAVFSKQYAEFAKLRTAVHTNPQRYSSVKTMADDLHVSTSHFQSLYQKFFHVSCWNDLIQARLEKAKSFLCETDIPIHEIALLCGYSNAEHFFRQFKQATGQTPSAYRKARRT